MVSTYEIVAVIRPDLDEDALGGAIERIHQRIADHGGTVKTSERWGKRRLAYQIQKYRDGFYVLTIFSLEPGQVARLRQTVGLHEELLRFTVATHHPSPAPAAHPAPATAASAPAPSPSTASVAPSPPSAGAEARPPVTPSKDPNV
jgi:small subunit ribosomal protein S6